HSPARPRRLPGSGGRGVTEYGWLSFERGGAGDVPALRRPRLAAAYLVSDCFRLAAQFRPGRLPRRSGALGPGGAALVALRPRPLLRATLLLLRLHEGDRAVGPAPRRRARGVLPARPGKRSGAGGGPRRPGRGAADPPGRRLAHVPEPGAAAAALGG